MKTSVALWPWRALFAAFLVCLGCSSERGAEEIGDLSQAAGACPSSKCLIGGTCYSSGSVNPSSECQACQPSTSTSAWTNLPSSTSCTADLYSCTTDKCDGAGSCKHTLAANNCVVGATCYSEGTKNPLNSCQSCQSAVSTTAWSNLSSGASCTSDSLFCTSDVCNGAGTCTHALTSGNCLIAGACYAEGTANPSNACQSCQSTTSSSAWTNSSNTTACTSDGLSCTNDLCNGSGTCSHTLQANSCVIAGACYASGATNPANSCQSCNPSVSTTAWTTSANGATCGSDGLSCTTDICSAGICTHTLQAGTCAIGGACYAAGAANPSNSCQICQTASSTLAWTNVANNTACTDDGLACTTDTCQAGVCNHALVASTCLVGGTCYASGAFDPSVDCRSCQPAVSTSSFTNLAVGQTCLDDGEACTTDICTKHGSSTTCDHNAGNAGTVCRAAAGVCDKAETCTGSSAACPSDTFQASGVTCRAAAGLCDKAETCTGSAVDCPADGLQPAGYVCRAANGSGCDAAEACSGATAACPADAAQADGTTCTDDGNTCTVDLCQGGSCSHTVTATNCTIGATCYAAGAVNPANSCQTCAPAINPTGWTLLTDGNACASDGLSCTADVCGSGLCTHTVAANTCAIGGACYASGATNPGNSCQACAPATSSTTFTVLANGSACDDDGLSCTTDTCSAGACSHTLAAKNCLIGGVCYADGAFDPSVECRKCDSASSTTAFTALAVGSTCLDDGNSCTSDVCAKHGNTIKCDHDAAPAGTVCRSKQGECDQVETCPGGGSTVCPADGFATATTTCSDDGNPCTTDKCSGSSAACMHLAGNVGAVCRAAASDCDSAELCNGTSTCPSDVAKADGAACTDEGNACTVDTCAAGVCLHSAGNAGTICRAARDGCDFAEVCDGTATCPADTFSADGTACNDGDACTQSDVCQSGACAGSNPRTCTPSASCVTSSCSPATGQCVETPIASCFTANLDYVKVSVDYTVPKSVAAVAECNTLNNWSATKLNPKTDCVPQTISTFSPFVMTRLFDGVCPKGSSPQWQYFVYTTSTPPDTRIEFRFRAFATTMGACAAKEPVISGAPTPIAIASLTQDPEVCSLSGSGAVCPKNLFTSLGGLPAGRSQCLQMDVYGVPSTGATPELLDWNVTYSCLPSE